MLTKIDSVVPYCWSDPSPTACNNALYPKQIQFLFQLILLGSDPVSCELHIKLIVSVSFEPNNWLPSVYLPSMKGSKRYLDNPNQRCGLSPDHIYHSLCFLYHLDIFGVFTCINKCIFHKFPHCILMQCPQKYNLDTVGSLYDKSITFNRLLLQNVLQCQL